MRSHIIRHGVRVLVASNVIIIVSGCSMGSGTATAWPTLVPQPTEAMESAATQEAVNNVASPNCPSPRGNGTVSPALSIYSITFIVNGVEQVVSDKDSLRASPGDDLQVKEVTICAGSFTGSGGEACVDFAPINQADQEMMSKHAGTHQAFVTLGFMSITGPSQRWIIGENWKSISAVINHWPPDGTEDLECGSGWCERDDQIVIGIR
jgi:hypothetical protein